MPKKKKAPGIEPGAAFGPMNKLDVINYGPKSLNWGFSPLSLQSKRMHQDLEQT